MHQGRMNRSLRAMALAGLATVPLGAGAASLTHGTAALAAGQHKTTHKSVTKKYKGPAVDMRWGSVRVTIYVKGKKITNVKASAPMERSRSAFINEQAIPMLHDEVLQAQSANIDVISGATMTSEAFAQSLQGALVKAHLASANG
jgi:uncharacterized protein with FMN-binding domain